MKTKMICETLEKYSPKGLCTDELIATTGAVPESCAMGCLLVGFLKSSEGAEFLAKNQEKLRRFDDGIRAVETAEGKVTATKVIKMLKGASTIAGNSRILSDAVNEFYGMEWDDTTEMMNYNDNCLSDDPDSREGADDSTLPRDLKRTIKRLRLKYEELHA